MGKKAKKYSEKMKLFLRLLVVQSLMTRDSEHSHEKRGAREYLLNKKVRIFWIGAIGNKRGIESASEIIFPFVFDFL
jgi:hypothetical protein